MLYVITILIHYIIYIILYKNFVLYIFFSKYDLIVKINKYGIIKKRNNCINFFSYVKSVAIYLFVSVKQKQLETSYREARRLLTLLETISIPFPFPARKPRLVSRRFSRRTVPACQQRRSPESRAHHFISMINTLHFMRIILRPLHPHVRAAQTSDPSPMRPRATPHASSWRFSPPRATHTCNAVVSLHARRSQPDDPLPRRPPASLSTTTSSATSSNPFLSCSLARPSVQPPPPRTQPIFFNVRQL